MSTPADSVGARLVARRPEPRDLVGSLVVAVLASGVYALTAQTRTHGDAAWMLMALVGEQERALLHPLLAPAHGLLRTLLGDADPTRTAYLLSHLCGGVGLGATFLLARGLGGTRVGAALACVLLGATPALWFFATTVEIHALHFALSALAACVVLFAPWRRPWLGALATLVVVPFVYASHQFSALLGLGWVALIRVGRERDGAPLRAPRDFLVSSGLVLAAFALAQVVMTFERHGVLGLDVGAESSMVAQYFDPGLAPQMLWWGWLACLGLLLPVGALGAGRPAATRALRWVPLAFLLPPLLFLLFVYPVPERGGFLLGSAPLLAAWAARVLGRPSWLWLPLVGAQLALGYLSLRSFDHGYDPAVRVERVRELVGEEGLLLVGDHLAPPIHFWLPEVIEVDAIVVTQRLAAHRETALEPGLLEELLRAHVGMRPVALDLARWEYPDRRSFVLREPTALRDEWMAELAAWIEERCVTERYDHESWPLLLVRDWRVQEPR